MRILLILFGLNGFLPGLTEAAEKAPWKPPISPTEILAALNHNPTGNTADELARKISATFGKQNLARKNVRPKVEATTVVWAATEKRDVSIHSPDGALIGNLRQIGSTGLQVLAKDVGNFQLLNYIVKADGKRIGDGSLKIEHYPVPPESMEQAGTPRGRIEKFEFRSKIFPDTTREVFVHVPAQYDDTPACLMVWQDGQRHSLRDKGLKAPVVIENLIHSKQMPVTIGIFIEPGRGLNQPPGSKARNRGFEYDGLGDLYPRFLLEELIPDVEKRYGLKLKSDPMSRAIGGGSSGGICAFKTAWERPDQFGRVLSWVGSFVNLRGGHVFSNIIRKTERKPIKVYLLDGDNDLDNAFGHWPTANLKMAAALKYMNYDYKLEWTKCFHGSTAMAAHLPDALRWLWNDAK